MNLNGKITSYQQPSDATVVIADPFFEKAASLASRLAEHSCHVVACSTICDAVAAFRETKPAFVLTELRFPDGPGLNLVRWISAQLPGTRTIVHTWFADIPTAVSAVKA